MGEDESAKTELATRAEQKLARYPLSKVRLRCRSDLALTALPMLLLGDGRFETLLGRIDRPQPISHDGHEGDKAKGERKLNGLRHNTSPVCGEYSNVGVAGKEKGADLAIRALPFVYP